MSKISKSVLCFLSISFFSLGQISVFLHRPLPAALRQRNTVCTVEKQISKYISQDLQKILSGQAG